MDRAAFFFKSLILHYAGNAHTHLFWLPLEFAFQPFETLNAQDGQASILAGLSQSEEDSPQDAFCGNANGQQHLGKGQDIEGDAAQKDDHARSERQ